MLRLRAHSLEIEAGRYLNIEWEKKRFCKKCDFRVVFLILINLTL